MLWLLNGRKIEKVAIEGVQKTKSLIGVSAAMVAIISK